MKKKQKHLETNNDKVHCQLADPKRDAEGVWGRRKVTLDECTVKQEFICEASKGGGGDGL